VLPSGMMDAVASKPKSSLPEAHVVGVHASIGSVGEIGPPKNTLLSMLMLVGQSVFGLLVLPATPTAASTSTAPRPNP